MYSLAASYHLSSLLLLAFSFFQNNLSFSFYFGHNYGHKCYQLKADHYSASPPPLFSHRLPFLQKTFYAKEQILTSTSLQTHTLDTAISNYSNSEIGSDFQAETFTPLPRSSSFSTSTMDQIRDFLINSNIKDFKFVPITEREVIDANDEIVHVKSLVWEITYLPTDQDQTRCFQNRVFYIMTALPIDLFIDEKKLLKEAVQPLLQNLSDENLLHAGETMNENWKMKLAERKLTEELTGCKIGSISPICAVFSDMNLDDNSRMTMLLIDHSLFQQTNTPDLSYSRKDETVISVGSGCLDHDLYIQIDDIINVCKDQYEQGVYFADITATEMNTPLRISNGDTDTVTSDKAPGFQIKTTTTTVTTTTVTTTKVMKSNTNNIETNVIEDSREIPEKPLSKRLRDCAGKLGKAEQVKSLIEEAGDDFPSVCKPYSSFFI